MKIVLDTNVLVSGLLRPFGVPGEIVRLVASGDLSICYDIRILSEYQDVLFRPKFRFDRLYLNALLDGIKASGYVVSAKPLAKALPDPTDEPFLEVAISGGAQCLITGNPKHYPASPRNKMLILTPKEFLKLLQR